MKKISLLSISLLFFIQCTSKKEHVTETRTSNGFSYEIVRNDPSKTRVYTLENGLKVYLSKNSNSPRIHVFTAIKAGGKNDPEDNTGLAHYLEHMMFKGTDAFGTKDFEREKVYLDSIERLFNEYGKLTDPEARKSMYAQIDEILNKAAEFAIPNEYDKMISLLGGKGLNAYTTDDRTVYTVDIPTNELERFLKIEGNRFKMIVNRLFHTELKAVYEEKNRSLDNDNWKVYESMYKHIFPSHPYGKQTVIGTIDHLKNPSITAIKDYFDTYYRPNNAAICMSGDLDFDKTIALINENFGDWKPNHNLPKLDFKKNEPITNITEAEVIGPQEERISIGFRFDGTHSEQHLKVTLIDMILNNSSAGLIDLNLMQQQKVLRAGSYVDNLNDLSILTFYGYPKAGQSLDEVKELILAQIDSLKQGKFAPWLLEAVVNDLKKNKMEREDSENANYFRANEMVMAFTNDTPWIERVQYFDDLDGISSEELIDFANLHYNENYVLIKKLNGEDNTSVKVEKPQITKVPLNQNDKSDFHLNIESLETEKLKPQFLNFEEDLMHYTINDIAVIHKENSTNDLFELTCIFDFGNNADPTIGMALSGFLNYVGTSKYSPEEIKEEFYKLGSNYNARGTRTGDRMFITLSGLSENFEASLKLFEHLLNDASTSEEVIKKYREREIKQRENNLKNKGFILWNGLYNYAEYGEQHPMNQILSNKEINALKVSDLTTIIQQITSYPHRIMYYGNFAQSTLSDMIIKNHTTKFENEKPAVHQFVQKDHKQRKVYWTHYDMVQTELILLAKAMPFDTKLSPIIQLFNEYFGGGMNSIVFQEIREAQGLAYAVFSNFSQPSKKEHANALFSYIGIQADKQEEALASMFNLIQNLPETEQAFDIAKKSILNKIESERILKTGVLDAYLSAEDRGLKHDLREDIYNQVQKLTFNDLLEFHQKNIKPLAHNIILIGHRDKIDFDNLAQYGEVTELTHKELFGY